MSQFSRVTSFADLINLNKFRTGEYFLRVNKREVSAFDTFQGLNSPPPSLLPRVRARARNNGLAIYEGKTVGVRIGSLRLLLGVRGGKHFFWLGL